jgi:hypothetical protein
MPKTTQTPCRATPASGITVILSEEMRVLEAAGWVVRAYRAQRANESAGFWLMMRELAKAVDEAETARMNQP